MKRLYIAGLLLFAAVSLQAQTLDGALLAAENNYYGTARSMALGNAVSALGGDLGSIGINPAGSAVANYSQVTFTPGFSTSRIGTTFTSPENTSYFNQLNKTLGRLPNVGTSLVFPMGGGNSMSFGFIANATNYYSETMSVSGKNASTSQLGAFAQMANGIEHSVFEDGNSGYYDLQTAFDAYLIDEINGTDDQYIGATENKYYDEEGDIYVELGDEIGQKYLRKRSGYKTDVIFNFGYNIQDQLYLGVNVGLPIMEFRDDFTFRENSLRDGYFQTGFLSSEAYQYVAYSGVGAYAKFGVIWRPVGGLRIAAAYQTPTSFSIDEDYGWSAFLDATEVADSKNRKSADGNFSYTLTTPSIASLGAAYIIGDIGLVSFDWERTNYSKMYFSPERMDYDYYSAYFDDVNTEIRRDAGVSNQYRVGAEVRLTPSFTLRGGYAENSRKLSDGKYSTRRSISGGLGLVSAGSFFADLALRWNILPDYFNYPYDLYNEDFSELVYESPIINASRRSLDAVVTLGWRF